MSQLQNVSEFKADLAKLSKALDHDYVALRKRVAWEIYNEFTLRNPVDTGYSRANWKIGIGEIDESVSTPPARGGGAVMPSPPPDLGLISQINAENTVYITNSVDYIQYLNEGTSKQAPSGWIQISIAAVEARVDFVLGLLQEP